MSDVGAMDHMRLPELIPVGGIFSIQVPAVKRGHQGILVMKLRDNSIVKLLNWDGSPCFEVISEAMAYYPIAAYHGTFLEIWKSHRGDTSEGT